MNWKLEKVPSIHSILIGVPSSLILFVNKRRWKGGLFLTHKIGYAWRILFINGPLILMNVFKQVMIVNRKFAPQVKLFVAIRDESREGWGETWRERGGLNFLVGRIRAPLPPAPHPSLKCKSWSTWGVCLVSLLL